jgi:GT2 family glycosyltransferase
MTEPIVTVLISPREGHFLSERSLLSVLADDSIPFELIYLDIASPPDIERAIRAQADARGFRIHRRDDWVAPTLARKPAMAEIGTKYVACIDNDVLVEPGCLKKLVDCAEETGAGLVCPLYIQSGGGRPPTIHMAGGYFAWSDDDPPELIGESHRLAGASLDAASALTRRPADYTEYHYVLGRMDLMGRPEAISEEILLIHEHLDLALVARRLGLPVMVEPAARATYVAFESRPLRDVPFYRRRWAEDACRSSVLAFGRKWGRPERPALVGNMLNYSAYRLREVEIRRPGSAGTDLAEPMVRAELAQDRCALREQAMERGYGESEVRALDWVADFATSLFDGLYRPDGRPFLNHVIGTASALVRYELELDIVLAGLLHAAFTHRPARMTETQLTAALSRFPKTARVIHAQPATRAFLAKDDAILADLNMVGAAATCILAANDADMRLSGEYRATGRPYDLSDTALDRVGEVLGVFSLEGLAKSARLPIGEVREWPLFGNAARKGSFRLDVAPQG